MHKLTILLIALVAACEGYVPTVDMDAVEVDAPMAARESTGPNGITAVLNIKRCGSGVCTFDGTRSEPGDGATQLTAAQFRVQTGTPGVQDTIDVDPSNILLDYDGFTQSGQWWVVLHVEDDAGFADNDIEFARVK